MISRVSRTYFYRQKPQVSQKKDSWTLVERQLSKTNFLRGFSSYTQLQKEIASTIKLSG